MQKLMFYAPIFKPMWCLKCNLGGIYISKSEWSTKNLINYLGICKSIGGYVFTSNITQAPKIFLLCIPRGTSILVELSISNISHA